MNTPTGLQITVHLQEGLVDSFFSSVLTPGRTAADKVKELTRVLEAQLVGWHAQYGLLPGPGDTLVLASRQHYRVMARRLVAGPAERCEVVLEIDQFG